MKFNGKFEKLVEETGMRMQLGGLLEGDYVKLIKRYERNKKIEGRSQQYFENLHNMFKGDLPVKITAIKAERTESTNGVVGASDAPTGFWADIVVEYAPGLWTNVTTVPLEILEKVDTGNNFGVPTPASWKHKDKINIKPVEVRQADNNKNLPKKNTKLKH